MSYLALRLELPYKASPLYWRTLGAATLSIVNDYNFEPENDYKDRQNALSRRVPWFDRSGTIALLKFCEGDEVDLADLIMVGKADKDGISEVARYMFDVITSTDKDTHNLAVIRNYVPNTDQDTNFFDLGDRYIKTCENYESLARANDQDAQDLLINIMSSPYASLSCL